MKLCDIKSKPNNVKTKKVLSTCFGNWMIMFFLLKYLIRTVFMLQSTIILQVLLK